MSYNQGKYFSLQYLLNIGALFILFLYSRSHTWRILFLRLRPKQDVNYFSICLTVRATYIDLYTIGCTIEPPVVWYIQKCMLIWKICFYFSRVFAIFLSKMKTRHVKRDRFTEKVLSRWDNFQLARSFHILWLGIGR